MTGKRINIDVLIFVEDPGAANFVAPVHVALQNSGKASIILSTGTALKCLSDRDIKTTEIHASDSAEGILDDLAPHILLIGTSENPDSMGFKLRETARLKKIPTVGVIDRAANAGYRFRGRSSSALTHAPDWLIVADEWAKKLFIHLGYQADKIVICGNPHFDYVMDVAARLSKAGAHSLRNRILPGIGKNQPAVVFVSEGVARLRRPDLVVPVHEYTLKGWGSSRGRTEIVLEEFLTVAQSLSPRPYLILRPHPKDVPDEYHDYLKYIDYIDTKTSPLKLVYCADLIVGATCMLLQEAAVMGRPVLSILPRTEEKDWLQGVRTGIIPFVTTRDELRTIFFQLLREGTTLRNRSHAGFIYGSTQRVMSFLEWRLQRSVNCDQGFCPVTHFCPAKRY
jgi:hypothetical protein